MKSGPRSIDMTGEVFDRLTAVSYQVNGKWLERPARQIHPHLFVKKKGTV
jgi:hypothetical protein